MGSADTCSANIWSANTGSKRTTMWFQTYLLNWLLESALEFPALVHYFHNITVHVLFANYRSQFSSLNLTYYRNSRPKVFCKKYVFNYFTKFTGKRLNSATLLKKRIWHRCFLWIFEILKNTFFIEHLWWLLLMLLYEPQRLTPPQEFANNFLKFLEKLTSKKPHMVAFVL